MRRLTRALLTGLASLALLACGQGTQEAPLGQPTPPQLQTPVPDQPGQPPPTVIPMPQPTATRPPSERETLIPTVQP